MYWPSPAEQGEERQEVGTQQNTQQQERTDYVSRYYNELMNINDDDLDSNHDILGVELGLLLPEHLIYFCQHDDFVVERCDDDCQRPDSGGIRNRKNLR